MTKQNWQELQLTHEAEMQLSENTKLSLTIQKKEAIILKMRAHHEHIQSMFRAHYMENIDLRSFLLLYAINNSEDERAIIDKSIAKALPEIWTEIQEWRDAEREISEQIMARDLEANAQNETE